MSSKGLDGLGTCFFSHVEIFGFYEELARVS